MDSPKSDFSHGNFAESMYKHKTHVFMLLTKSASSALCLPGVKGRGEGARALRVGFGFGFKSTRVLKRNTSSGENIWNQTLKKTNWQTLSFNTHR